MRQPDDATVPGPRSIELASRLAAVECPAFARRRATRAGADAGDSGPIVLASGRGHVVHDVDGHAYVDLAAGFGAAALGHGHPALAAAIGDQAERLVQGLGDVYGSDIKLALLERLAALHPAGDAQVLLGQSGADAVTAALKTATLATGRHVVIAFEGGYHGLGYGPLPACGFRAGFYQPFAPQLGDRVRFAPYPGVRGATVEAALARVDELLGAEPIAAILVEPLMGRGGCVVPPDGFIEALCRLAHTRGALVIADEIWVGLGRAGAMVCSPPEVDILCFGKGLGGGVPVSACVARREAMAGWARGGEVVHTSTHAGAPLACAAALCTLDVIEHDELPARALALGHEACVTWRRLWAGHQAVVELRGRGLMLGVQLDSASRAMAAVRALLRRGYLVITGGVEGDVLTLTPPLTIERTALLGFGEALHDALLTA